MTTERRLSHIHKLALISALSEDIVANLNNLPGWLVEYTEQHNINITDAREWLQGTIRFKLRRV